MQPETIQKILEQALPEAEVTITSGDNIHFQATVISPQFKGLSKLAQHRIVYKALQEELKEKIHALQLTTKHSRRQSSEQYQ